MKERIYLINIYEYYSTLLTERQISYFEDYYYNNLTLSEMSENYGVSRSAIQKTLKEVEVKLNYFEDNLHLFLKRNEVDKVLEGSELKQPVLEILER